MIFLESPWPILLVGIAAEVILAVMLIRTGRGVFLAAMAGVAVVAGVGLLIEQWVITDKKAVAATIDAAAAACERNDLPGVLEFLAPEATTSRNDAKNYMGQGHFEKVTIRNLDTEIVRTTSPPTATATFTVIATGQPLSGVFGRQTLTRPFQMRVHLKQAGSRWLITGHHLITDPREP